MNARADVDAVLAEALRGAASLMKMGVTHGAEGEKEYEADRRRLEQRRAAERGLDRRAA